MALEYRVERFSLIGSDWEYNRDTKLESLGAQGWRLVAVVGEEGASAARTHYATHIAYFVRNYREA